MRWFTGFLAALLPIAAFAQTVPNGGVINGQTWSINQWNSAWQSKVDNIGGTLANGILTNPTVTAGSFNGPTITGGSWLGGTFSPTAITNTPISGSTGAFTSLSATGAINTTSTSGYQLSGQNGLRVTLPATEYSVLVGPYAGQSLPSTAQFVVAVGHAAFESLTAMTSESVAIGSAPAISATTLGGLIAIGTSACASETTQGNSICIGSDAMRDVWDASGGDLAIGAGAYVDGAGAYPNFAFGTNTLWGAASTITIGGTITTGDQLAFTFSSANPCGGGVTINCTTNVPVTVTYTVQSSDASVSVLAGHLASALSTNNVNYTLGDGSREGDRNLFAMQFGVADATNHPTVIKGHYPSSWQIAIAYTCTGTCGETAVIGAGFTGGQNILMGNSLFMNPLLTTASNNVINGQSGPQNFVTTASYNSFYGNSIAPNLSTGTFNNCWGYNSCNGLTSGSQNAVLGSYTAYGLTTGQTNTILGDETVAGQNCITTGSHNLEAGQGACVQSPTASNQMSIQNIIYGTGNSGTGSTVSTGSVGIGQTAPGARFDILGTDTSSSTLAFRVLNSGLTNLLSIGDDGTIKVGSSTGLSCSGTPSSSFASVNGIVTHC